MADPFSVIGVLAVAIDNIERAKKIIEGISGAPQAIGRLHNELKAISQLLHQIHTFILQIHAADSLAQDSFIPHLQAALANCKNVASDVDTLLRPYLKPTGDPQRSTWRRLAWSFKEQKTAGLEKDMATCKQTLNMAISFADLAVSSRSNHRVIKIERGVKQIQMNLGIDSVSVADSDYAGSVDTAFRRNIMTSQWIMQADTVVEETIEEIQSKEYEEYHNSSDESNEFSGTSDEKPPIEPRIPPTMREKVERSGKRLIQTLALKQNIKAKQTQPPVKQKTVVSTSERFQLRSVWMPNTKTTKIEQTLPGDGQLIRKSIVSREALQVLGMKFSEEGKHVRLSHRIEAETLQRLRSMSESLSDRKLWWADPPSKPAIGGRGEPLYSQAPSSSRVIPSGHTLSNRSGAGQKLRKTIVSRSALAIMRVPYWEDAKYVFPTQELQAETVRNLRALSVHQSQNPRDWWS